MRTSIAFHLKINLGELLGTENGEYEQTSELKLKYSNWWLLHVHIHVKQYSIMGKQG